MSLNLLNKHLHCPQLWLANLEGSSDSLNSDFLDESSTQRYHRLSSPKKRQQFLLSRWLIKYAVNHLFGIHFEDVVIDDNTDTCPKLPQLTSPFFCSLSHSHDWVASVFAYLPCGVYIEIKKPRNNMIGMAKSFMSKREYELYSSNTSQDYFYQCWCIKEAFYKSLPRSTQFKTPFHTIDTGRLSQSPNCTLSSFTSEQYQLAVFFSSTIEMMDAYLVAPQSNATRPFTSTSPMIVSWEHFPIRSLCK